MTYSKEVTAIANKDRLDDTDKPIMLIDRIFPRDKFQELKKEILRAYQK